MLYLTMQRWYLSRLTISASSHCKSDQVWRFTFIPSLMKTSKLDWNLKCGCHIYTQVKQCLMNLVLFLAEIRNTALKLTTLIYPVQKPMLQQAHVFRTLWSGIHRYNYTFPGDLMDRSGRLMYIASSDKRHKWQSQLSQDWNSLYSNTGGRGVDIYPTILRHIPEDSSLRSIVVKSSNITSTVFILRKIYFSCLDFKSGVMITLQKQNSTRAPP
jgi:hypothetical protein